METNIPYAGTRGTASRTIHFDIRKGHFSQWMGRGQETRDYDYVQGRLIGIALRKRETPNGEMTCLDLRFRNGDVRFDVSAIADSHSPLDTGHSTAESYERLVAHIRGIAPQATPAQIAKLLA